MTANLSRRLRAAVPILAVCIAVSLCYQFIDTGIVSLVGLAIGFTLAIPLILLEGSAFDELTRRLPFSLAVLIKSLTYIGCLYSVFMLAGLVNGWWIGLTMNDFWVSLTEPSFGVQVAAGFGLYTIVVFIRQLDRLLGPGVLST